MIIRGCKDSSKKRLLRSLEGREGERERGREGERERGEDTYLHLWQCSILNITSAGSKLANSGPSIKQLSGNVFICISVAALL